MIIGFSFNAPVLHIVGGFVLLLLIGYAFSWVFALVGLVATTPESANSIGFIADLPAHLHLVGIRAPGHDAALCSRAFANVNPFTIFVDAMRALWLGRRPRNYVWGAVVWALVILAVFAPLAVGATGAPPGS